VRDLLKRCLVKDARQRLRDIGDARLELDLILASGTSGAMTAFERPGAGAKARGGPPWWALAATAVGAIVVTALILTLVGGRDDRVMRRFEIGAPEPFGLAAEPHECVISPNGRMLALVLTDSAVLPGARSAGNERRDPTVLVARQSLARVLRRRQAQESRAHRGRRRDSLRRAGIARRSLESR
jgi:hypothetical protein